MAGEKGRGRQTPNYKPKVLLEIVRGMLPISTDDWQKVAKEYQTKTNEAIERTAQQMKRQFVQKMCNSMKKVTGQSAPQKATAEAQAVYNKILELAGAGDYGAEDYDVEESSEDDDDDEDYEDEEPPEGTDASAQAAAPAANYSAEFAAATATIDKTAPATARKRKTSSEADLPEERKTKNSRPKNPALYLKGNPIREANNIIHHWFSMLNHPSPFPFLVQCWPRNACFWTCSQLSYDQFQHPINGDVSDGWNDSKYQAQILGRHPRSKKK